MGAGVLPHGTRAPTEGFFYHIYIFSRSVCLGYHENRVITVFFEVITHQQLQCVQ